MGYTFVKEVLNIVLPSKPTKAYSSELVGHLLRREVVSASMVPDGLLTTLQVENDSVRAGLQPI